MKQLRSVQLVLLSGLLLVAAAACTDQTTARAPTTEVPPDAADIEPIATAQLETYTVQPGDFLSDIAARYQITLEALTTHNQIVDAALIDVGQILEIPGTAVVSIDSFFAAAPAERFPELYPPQQLPPPPPPTVIDQLQERLAALPWPERQVNVLAATIGIFALASLLGWVVFAKILYHSRRFAFRNFPRWARATWHAWGAAARQPRRAINFLVPHSVRTWRVSVQIARVVAAAASAVWRITRPVLAALWAVTRPLILRIWEAIRPAINAAIYFVWNGSRQTNNHVPRNRKQQRANASNWLPGQGDSASQKTKWRSENAAELAAAFETKQIEVRYRPVIDLDSNTLSAVETRLYWRHPKRGLLTGKDIYPATDQHPELGRALLELLVGQGSKFVGETLQKRYPSAQLIVPLTRQQIIESEPLSVIDWAISNADLSLDRLVVSVEESHILRDPAAATDFVRNVRAMGLAAQLDGYRQLGPGQLRALEVSSVSADFQGVASGDIARQQVKDAIEAAQELRLPITAKHARSEVAQTLVARMGCSFEAVGEPLTERAFIASYVDRSIEGDPTPPADPELELPTEQVA
ncbi:MAG: EAL domain-containing protein [Dehalococcoidia bacterium]|jgi:EAL domain-containing protein (putative c-di-GMP-specific phosphodiesterase class I)/LysM repeat protein|nr:EAL domain-containing protein [Dehalococcoidia bacterium]